MMSIYTTYIEYIYNDEYIYTTYIEDIYNDEYIYYLYWGYLQW